MWMQRDRIKLTVLLIVVGAYHFYERLFLAVPADYMRHSAIDQRPPLLLRDELKRIDFIYRDEDLCKRQPSDARMVVLVLSKLTHFEKRQAIRLTWANTSTYRPGLKLTYTMIFLVGGPTTIERRDRVVEEIEMYHDVIVMSEKDEYFRLTVKTMIGFRWLHMYCPGTRFVLKVDDDVYVNLQSIENEIFLNSTFIKMAEANKIYGGYIQKDPKVIRGSSKKLKYARWLVRKTEFGPDNYPSFANGPFYFVSYSLIADIVRFCPNHCMGQKYYNLISPKKCFWKFEDAFLGSCLEFLSHPPVFFNISGLGVNGTKKFLFDEIKFHLMKHQLFYPWVIHSIKEPRLLLEIHQLQTDQYLNINNEDFLWRMKFFRRNDE